jgi:tRNA G10  N-methylase Trm11
MAVALVISYNIAMVNRQRGSLDIPSSSSETKRPKRLGLYKEGKSMMEKIVKETFKPDPDEKKLKKKVKREVKKVDKVITNKEIEEKMRRGAVVPSTDKRKLEHYKKMQNEK